MNSGSSKVFEDLFTNRSYKISEDPAVFIKEGVHTVVLENNVQNEEKEYKTFNVNTMVVKDKEKALGVVVYCESEEEPESSKGSSEILFDTFSEVAACVVHEIKNPLFAIRGFLQILDNSLPEGDKRKEYIKIMISEVDRLESLVKEFLMMVKTQQNDNKGLVWVGGIVNEVVELFKNSFENKKIRLNVQTKDEAAFIWANKSQLEQVLVNLLQNAFEATDEGGSVEVAVLKDNGKILIEVRDSGRGISPEIGNKIFTPFYTTKKDGTGLGLFISKKIVENLGGKIYFDSEEGKGTRFVIEFPVRRPGAVDDRFKL